MPNLIPKLMSVISLVALAIPSTQAAQTYKYIKSVTNLVVDGSVTPPPPSGPIAMLELSYADALEGNFGDVQPGTTETVNFIVTNTSENAATGLTASLSGAGNTFMLDSTCSSTLPAGTSCIISVTYAPATASDGIYKTLVVEASNTEEPAYASMQATTVETPSVEILMSSSPDLGNVKVGSSKTVNFVVTNTSWGSPITSFRADLIGDYPMFSIESSCGPDIPIGGSCVVAVTYTPTAETEWSSILLDIGASNLNNDYYKNVTATSLNGVATASISGNAVSLENTVIGTVKSKVFQITNTGINPVLRPHFEIYGFNNHFSLGASTCTSQIAVGSSCSVTVLYAPTTQTGYEEGVLQLLADNMPGAMNQTMVASANEATVVTLPPTITMTYSLPGDQTNDTRFRVEGYDFGLDPVPVISQVYVNSANNEFSTVVLKNSGTPCSSVMVDTACYVHVIYTPVASSNAINIGTIRTTVNGTTHDTVVTAYTDSYTVTSNLMGGATASDENNYVRVTTGHVNISQAASAQLVKNGTVFAATSSVDNFIKTNANDLSIKFNSPVLGSYDLYIYDANGKRLALFQNAVTVNSYAMTVTPDAGVDFGDAVGIGTSERLSFTVANTGIGAISGLNLKPYGAGISIDAAATTCGSTLATGATCKVFVKFTPIKASNLVYEYGSLIVTSTQLGSSTIDLTGTSVVPVDVSTSYAYYGNVNVGDESLPTGSIAVMNQSQKALTNVNLTITGANAGDFTYSATYLESNTACPATLEPGDYCIVSIKPAPSTAGSKSAKVQITSDTYSNNSLVTISANGVQPTASANNLLSGGNGNISISSTVALSSASSVVLKAGNTTVATSSTISYTPSMITAAFTTLPAAGTYTVHVLNAAGTTIAKAGSIVVSQN